MSRGTFVARNVLSTLVTQGFSWALACAVTLVLPGYVQDSGLGALALAASFAGVVAVFVSLGTSTALVKEISRNRDRTAEMVAAALWLRVPVSLLALLVGWWAANLMGYGETTRLLILVALAGMALGQVSEVLSCALRGLEEISRQNAITLAEKLLVSLVTIGLVFLRAPLWTFAATAILGSLVSICLFARFLWPHLRQAHRPELNTMHEVLRAGMPFLASAIFVAIYGQSGTILLSMLSSIESVGWYGLAQRLSGATLMFPVAVMGALLPTLSRMHLQDSTAMAAAARRLFNLMLLSVIPIAAPLLLAPEQIVRLLHYPAGFNGSIPVLRITSGSIILWFLSQAAGTLLIASDRQAVFSRVTAVAAVISVPLCAACILLTRRFFNNGAIGAVIADTLVEAYLLAAYLRALPRGYVDANNVWMLARAAAAALPLILCFYLAPGRHALSMLLLGTLLYAPICLALRCFHPGDVAILRRLCRMTA